MRRIRWVKNPWSFAPRTRYRYPFEMSLRVCKRAPDMGSSVSPKIVVGWWGEWDMRAYQMLNFRSYTHVRRVYVEKKTIFADVERQIYTAFLDTVCADVLKARGTQRTGVSWFAPCSVLPRRLKKKIKTNMYDTISWWEGSFWFRVCTRNIFVAYDQRHETLEQTHPAKPIFSI